MSGLTQRQPPGPPLLGRRRLALPPLASSSVWRRPRLRPLAAARLGPQQQQQQLQQRQSQQQQLLWPHTHHRHIHAARHHQQHRCRAVGSEGPHHDEAGAERKLEVVFVATEVAPWSHVGGLGDAMAALPAALAARGHRVMTVAPRYPGQAGATWDTGVHVPVRLPAAEQAAGGGTDDQQHQEQQQQQLTEDGLIRGPDSGGGNGSGPAASEAVAAASQRRPAIAGAAPPPPPPAVGYAAYHVAAAGADGVVRVFVDHTAFGGGGSGGSGGGAGGQQRARPSTYVAGRDGAAGRALAAGYSVLCQAALAAPVLLWDRRGGGGADRDGSALLRELRGGRAPGEVAAALAASAAYPKAISHGLARPAFEAPPNLLGLANGAAPRKDGDRRATSSGPGDLSSSTVSSSSSSSSSSTSGSSGGGAAVVTATAASRSSDESGPAGEGSSSSSSKPRRGQDGGPSGGAGSSGGGAKAAEAAAEFLRARPGALADDAAAELFVSALLQQSSSSSSSSSGDGGGGVGIGGGLGSSSSGIESGSSSGGGGVKGEELPIVFVGNDWPAGLLPLWLETYRLAAGDASAEAAAALREALASGVPLTDGARLSDLLLAAGQQERGGAAATEADDADTAAASTPDDLLSAGGETVARDGGGRASTSGGGSSDPPEQQQPSLAALSLALSDGMRLGALDAAAADDADDLDAEGQWWDSWLDGDDDGDADGSGDDWGDGAEGAAGEPALLPRDGASAAAGVALPELARLRDEIAAWDARWVELRGQVGALREAVEAAATAGPDGDDGDDDSSEAALAAAALAEAQAALDALVLEERLLSQVADQLRAALAAGERPTKGAVMKRLRRQLAAEIAAAATAAAAQDGSSGGAPAGEGATIGPADGAAAAERLAAQLGALQRLLGEELASDAARVALVVHNGGVDGEFGGGADGDGSDDTADGGDQAAAAAAAEREAESFGIAPAAVKALLAPVAAVADAARAAAGFFARVASFGRKRDEQQQQQDEQQRPDSDDDDDPGSGTDSDGDDDDDRPPTVGSGGSGGGSDGQGGGGGSDGSGSGGTPDGSASPRADASSSLAADAPRAPPQAEASDGAGDVASRGLLGAAFSWLAAGLAAADGVITVSQGYAAELRAGAGGGAAAAAGALPPGSNGAKGGAARLAGVLAAREAAGRSGLSAVLNGLDGASWDPSTDALLPLGARAPADVLADGASLAAWKARAKRLLQQRLGLAEDPHTPLFVFLGRLDAQKGADVVLAALPGLLALNDGDGSDGHGSSTASAGAGARVQVAVLGEGLPWMERAVADLAVRAPSRAAGVAAFSPPLARLLLAGADFALLPSRYEPCGLVALAALRYGAVPIAAATGGLRDIVTPDVGFASLAPPGPDGDPAALRAAAAGLVAAAREALLADGSGGDGKDGVGVGGATKVAAMRAAGMARPASWEGAAAEYERIFLELIEAPPAAAGAAASSTTETLSAPLPAI